MRAGWTGAVTALSSVGHAAETGTIYALHANHNNHGALLLSTRLFPRAALVSAVSALLLVAPVHATPTASVNKLWTFTAPAPIDSGAAEIVAVDYENARVFASNAQAGAIDILNLADGSKIGALDVSGLGGLNSVAVKNNVVAVALENTVSKQDPGAVAFFQADNGAFLNSVTVGALPDMLTFAPDGQRMLVANEGEPNDAYTVDPEGSVSIIDLSGGVGSAPVFDSYINNRLFGVPTSPRHWIWGRKG